MPSNRLILIVISALLFGILGFLALDQSRNKTFGETVDEATEEIRDEIDDHTTIKTP